MPFLRPPSKKLLWTAHAREKMGYYRLSEARVKRVLNMPERVETGVAPKTVAMMHPVSIQSTGTEAVPWQRRGFRGAARGISKNFTQTSANTLDTGKTKPKWSQEIWVMVQDIPTGRKIISAWRYPGVSKVRDEIQDIMRSEYNEYVGKD